MACHHHPPFFSHVCKRYGAVLYDLSKEVIEELACFVEWADASGCWSLLKEPSLSPRIHTHFFSLFFQHAAYNAVTFKVLSVLSTNKRLGFLPEFLSYVTYLKDPHKAVYLHTSKQLPKKSISHLTKRLKEEWNIPVEIHQFEDSQLLLGGVFLWDNFMIDASLKTMLTHLRSKKDYVLSPS